jgi:uncharacterized protein YlxW (UPF0749 family)
MRKTRGPEKRVHFVWRLAAALAMTACLVLVVQFAVIEHAQHRKYEVLRAEQEKLQADLQAVKKRAEDAQPVVVLENDRGTRVIIDLESETDSAIQPASLKTYD